MGGTISGTAAQPADGVATSSVCVTVLQNPSSFFVKKKGMGFS